MDFRLDISALESTQRQVKGAAVALKKSQHNIFTTNSILATDGWGGKSAHSFRDKNDEWNTDFSTYLSNVITLDAALSSVLGTAQNLSKQVLGLAKIFGGSAKGSSKEKLGLSYAAKAQV